MPGGVVMVTGSRKRVRKNAAADWWGVGEPPESATWPRLMSGRHPRAVGSYGPAMTAWAEGQTLHPKRSRGSRWWQQLAANRALEHDDLGRLVWPLVIVSGPRQTGKSWLERNVCAWRMSQAEQIGEEQSVLHVAHKLIAAQEVWRPAARWAAGIDGASVRRANGEQNIELPDGSRWLVQAANDGAGVAFSLSMALIDEAWRVPRQVYDEAIEPTLAEAEWPQAWLVSTAGTSESDLMMTNRAAALACLEEPRDTLLIEWSAPPDPDLDIDDEAMWRRCQPHWDERRLEAMRRARSSAGERAFRQQWLNQWVPGVSGPLMGEEVWRRVSTMRAPRGELSLGAAVAADRASACIAAYGGGVAELIEQRDGAGWVAQRLAELAARHDAAGVGVPGSGPAAVVAADVEPLIGDLLVKISTAQLGTAGGQVFDRLTSVPPGLLLRADAGLAEAVAGAARRPGGSWSWSADAAGTTLGAVSAALWAGEHAGAEPPLVFV